MRRALSLAVVVLVAALVPLLLVTTSLRIVMSDWIVHVEYAVGRVPDDPYGLTRDERTSLALLGLRSIQPQHGEGVDLLREARLPDGSPAFTDRELRHMEDVRGLTVPLLAFQLWATLGLVVLAVALAVPHATRALVPRGIRAGVIAAVVIAAAAGVAVLVAWDRLFTGFHRLFFEGETWRFPSSDTLIRLYPDAFWVGVAGWLAGLTVLLAGLLWLGATAWLRAVRR